MEYITPGTYVIRVSTMQSRKMKYGRGFLGRELRKSNLLPECSSVHYSYLLLPMKPAAEGGPAEHVAQAIARLASHFAPPGHLKNFVVAIPQSIADSSNDPV